MVGLPTFYLRDGRFALRRCCRCCCCCCFLSEKKTNLHLFACDFTSAKHSRVKLVIPQDQQYCSIFWTFVKYHRDLFSVRQFVSLSLSLSFIFPSSLASTPLSSSPLYHLYPHQHHYHRLHYHHHHYAISVIVNTIIAIIITITTIIPFLSSSTPLLSSLLSPSPPLYHLCHHKQHYYHHHHYTISIIINTIIIIIITITPTIPSLSS